MVAKRSRPRAPTHGIHTAGKQYMAWVHSKDKVKRKETDGTLAKRAALLSQGHDAACYKQCCNEHPYLQLCAKMQQAHAAGRTSPQQETRSTRLTSARTAPSSRHAQDLPSSGPAVHRSGHSKSTGPNTGTSAQAKAAGAKLGRCLLYTSPSPRDRQKSRMPSSA